MKALRIAGIVIGGLAAAVLIAALVFQWSWIKPTAERVMSEAAGRDVRIGELDPLPVHVDAGAVVEQARGPKILWFKKRRRQNSKRKGGHRQDLTVLKVLDITTGGDKPAKKSKAKAKAEDAPAEASAEA